MATQERMKFLAQQQLEAYNERNLEKFLECYDKGVQVFSLNQNKILCNDWESFTQIYKKRFDENPDLNCELKSRIVLQNSVLDQEWVTGVVGQEKPSHLVAVYEFNEDKIIKVTFVR